MQKARLQSSPKAPGAAGYTLVEMAICLCVISLLLSGGIVSVSGYSESLRTRETRHKIDFVMNVLSAYVQTHDRLPCPADPQASPALAGREEDTGKCFVTAGAGAEGAVPWKELALPRDTVMDGWGRYITYRPALSLTPQTLSDLAKAPEVANACRSAAWYDADGNHLNWAKAMFCCNAWPDNRDTAPMLVTDAVSAASIEPAAGGVGNGSLSIPYYMGGPAAPLLRATDPAVTLTSTGPASRAGDIKLSLRSDQLFARVGSGSCAPSPAAIVRPYACTAQAFRNDSGRLTVKDPLTGAAILLPPLYSVNLGLAGKKYQLRASLTRNSEATLSSDDSLGFYVIGADGRIGDVQLLLPSVKQWAKGETENFSVAYDDKTVGIGLFVIPDGYNQLDGYRNIDLSHLKFVSNYARLNEVTASVGDQQPPVLVTVNAAGLETPVTGTGGVNVYHLYSNLNPGHAGRVLRHDSVCHFVGEAVGVNNDIICRQASSMTDAGIDFHSGAAQVGFEEGSALNCYELKKGGCRPGDETLGDRLPDGEGGYIASVGDNSFDDLAFSVSLATCPQGQ